MKKAILLLTLFTVNVLYSQLSKDISFASNGIYSLPAGSFLIGDLADTGSSVFYRSFDSNTNQFVISKATSYTGPLDNTFGNNGKIFLNYETDDLISFLRHADNKLTLLFKKHDAITNAVIKFDIIRLLPNGQPDLSFGIGGTKTFDATILFTDLFEQGNKILIFGQLDSPVPGPTRLLRINSDGTVDNSFGNNGELVFTSFPGYILVDHQSNIICFEPYKMIKYDSNGQLMTSFGNNGEAAFDPPLNVSKAFIDSNNKIACIDMSDTGSGGFGILKRINSDGTIDNTFNYTPPVGGAMILDLYEKSGYYYTAGNISDSSGAYSNSISKINQNGTLDSSVGYFVDNDVNLQNHSAFRIKVFDNSIITYGGASYYGPLEVVKYLLNSSTLSANESIQNREIQIENPVKDKLIIISKERINTIDIYSSNGMLVKQLTNNSYNVSDLIGGIYIIKINLQNGKNKTFKIIKR
ncbi:putative delta-60 repeat protein [Chryseobacterium defluvii]|uniref:Putative delta-60 repeat protein n=1 Tax=Chryseobacterium defluvii TaxID=160396 RepID=A0A840KB42_9FLAO|nr:T9SS type A sorting domain-containing protein [Chryseobacterium defluvii]MBB4805207.1 putative delta-60 repeat protein [Chryseobacterium defluvii]